MSGDAWIFAAIGAALALAFGTSLYWAGGRGGAVRGQSLALALAALAAVAALYAAQGTPRALNPLATGHGMAGVDPNEMVQRLAARLKENPDDLDGWLMLARSYMVLERYAEAEAAYERAQTRVMQDADLLVTWVQLRVMRGGRKFDPRSEELLKHAATLAPDNPDVLRLRALAALARGDKDESNALADQLRDRFAPGTPDRENLEMALQSWTLRDVPPPPQNANANAPAPAAMPDPQEMVQRLADRLKDRPDDLDGWLMLARSYAILGRYADADAAYEHAQSKAMQDAAQLVIWVEMRLRLNGLKFDPRAIELLNRAAELSPNSPNVLLLRALAAFGRGDKPGGDALVAQLHAQFPPGSPERENIDGALQHLMPPGGQ
jgi:cytochrome c-type biogenesis protein CcmH